LQPRLDPRVRPVRCNPCLCSGSSEAFSSISFTFIILFSICGRRESVKRNFGWSSGLHRWEGLSQTSIYRQPQIVHSYRFLGLDCQKSMPLLVIIHLNTHYFFWKTMHAADHPGIVFAQRNGRGFTPQDNVRSWKNPGCDTALSLMVSTSTLQ
jgi:hypothetical protein